jgi:regulator of protease activity HflC (stomatin/prohibitin superfamily)
MFIGTKNIITIIILIFTITCSLVIIHLVGKSNIAWIVIGAGAYIALSPRIIREWERGILLRLGKFKRILKPGIAWVIPGIDIIVSNVDMRIRTTTFNAEKTLTKDTVPVNVDAILFWVVTDAKKSILEVENFGSTVSWAAQTTLRDIIGKTDLVKLLNDRQTLDVELQEIIDKKTSEWGITVQSVEIRDVIIPDQLEDSMSRMAQADREREARIILADSELKVAESMEKASEFYKKNQTAMQLRTMNMTYEAIKERGSVMVIPSGMADSLNTGILGVARTELHSNPQTKNID